MNIRIPALVMVIAITQPFSAYAEDVTPGQTCVTYIEHGTWVYRYNEWTLELEPSACGRMVNPENTAHMFYEMAKKFGGSPYWQNTRGMINQLTCHLVIARNKPTWNLDPWRPYVGHNATVSAECNVVAPDPDTEFH
jgi:hypothetical protein